MPSSGIKGNKGGVKGRSGRKSKAEELGLQKLLDECWTLAERKACIKKLAADAKGGNMEATKTLLAYAYGKPVDRKIISGDEDAPIYVREVIIERTTKGRST